MSGAADAATATALPPVTYLTVDSMREGVGRSQVLPYVEGLARRGVAVTVHTFEKGGAEPAIARRLSAAGVRWLPHRFGAPGAASGLVRVAKGAAALRGADLVHARSDSAAAAALVGRRQAWVWDMRGFWREERMALGLLRRGSPEDRVMAAVEAGAARRSTGIVTLSRAAIDVLGERFGPDVALKSRVITTCVDLERFSASPLPPAPPVRFLLAGTLNALYDVEAMVRFVERVQARRRSELTVLSPDPSPWRRLFSRVGATEGFSEAGAMPDHVRAHHVGLSVRHADFRVTSTAATPTKIAEFLASGRPIVVSAGLGDMDDLLARHDCGVVVADTSDKTLEWAADEVDRLVDDPGTPARCRALAEEHFDLERGIDALVDLYREAVR